MLKWLLIIFLSRTDVFTEGNEQTGRYLAFMNEEGYSKDLLIKTIEEHPTGTKVQDKETLIQMLQDTKIREAIRDAAVTEAAKKVKQSDTYYRGNDDENLEDPGYCGYYWLSWLPWLECPENTNNIEKSEVDSYDQGIQCHAFY